MKENYYALLICILKPDYSIERSLMAMVDGVLTKVQNKSITKSDVTDMIQMKGQGMTYQKIGEIYSLSWDAVRRRVKRYKEVVAS